MVYNDFKPIVSEQIKQFYKAEHKTIYDQIIDCNNYDDFFKLLYSDYEKLTSILFTADFLFQIPEHILSQYNVFIRRQGINYITGNSILIECNLSTCLFAGEFGKIIFDSSKVKTVNVANETRIQEVLITGHSWMYMVLSDVCVYNISIDSNSYVTINLMGDSRIYELIMRYNSVAKIDCKQRAIIHTIKMFDNSTIPETILIQEEPHTAKIISLEVNDNAFARVRKGMPQHILRNGGLVMQLDGIVNVQEKEQFLHKLERMNVFGVMFALAEAKTGYGSYQDYLPEDSWKPLKPLLEKFILDLNNTTQTVF
jgi:hypothetical protein